MGDASFHFVSSLNSYLVKIPSRWEVCMPFDNSRQSKRRGGPQVQVWAVASKGSDFVSVNAPRVSHLWWLVVKAVIIYLYRYSV